MFPPTRITDSAGTYEPATMPFRWRPYGMFLSRIMIAAMLLACIGTIAVAQQEGTESGLQGQRVNLLASGADGTVLAATDSGVYRSIDNGITWSLTSIRSLTRGLAVGTNGVAYAAHYVPGRPNDALSRSTDHGATWEPHEASSVINALDLDSSGNPIIIVGDDILRSTDGGEHWVAYGTSGMGQDFYELFMLTSGPNGRIAVGNRGDRGGQIYVSSNGGATWKKSTQVTGPLRALEYSPDGTLFSISKAFHRSTDNGSTWSDVAGIGGTVWNMIVSGGEVIVLSDSGYYRSLDNGISWNRQFTRLPDGVSTTTFVRGANAEILVATTNGVYRFAASASVRRPLPSAGAMLALHPNPVRGALTIDLAPAGTSHARVTVVDVLGRTVATLRDGTEGAGSISLTWDTGDIPAGTYWIRVDADGGRGEQRMVIVN